MEIIRELSRAGIVHASRGFEPASKFFFGFAAARLMERVLRLDAQARDSLRELLCAARCLTDPERNSRRLPASVLDTNSA